MSYTYKSKESKVLEQPILPNSCVVCSTENNLETTFHKTKFVVHSAYSVGGTTTSTSQTQESGIFVKICPDCEISLKTRLKQKRKWMPIKIILMIICLAISIIFFVSNDNYDEVFSTNIIFSMIFIVLSAFFGLWYQIVDQLYRGENKKYPTNIIMRTFFDGTIIFNNEKYAVEFKKLNPELTIRVGSVFGSNKKVVLTPDGSYKLKII
ncbi:MAG: hypothetical protein INQ03_09400 [Candidatus Heimdallarchaeota archaeon]|nr:hypothetical protein [Candidatus Heimdallarchaeota archaeon]